MQFISRQEADLMLSNFCHLSKDEQSNIIDNIDIYTFDGVIYVFPSSETYSKNVFQDLMPLYIAIKERGHGRLATPANPDDIIHYCYGAVVINSDVITYRDQMTGTQTNVSSRVKEFYKLPFTLESVKYVVMTYASANMSRYFFSERIQEFGKFIRDFLCRYDAYTTWNKKVKDRNYRNEISFRKQIDALCSPDALISQQVDAAYNIFTWAGIEITDAFTRIYEPWRTLRADADGLEMIEKITADTYANKINPFSNPTLPGVTADMDVDPEYDVEYTEEDWLAETVTKELAAKALTAYYKSTDYNALITVRSTMINFTIGHDILAQHIYQYRGKHEIHLIPVTPASENGKVSWRYVLEDQMKKLYLLFSNASKNSEIYGLHVDQKDPSKMELIVIEKDKHNRYTFTG